MRLLALTAVLCLSGCLRSDPAPPLTGTIDPTRPGLKELVLKRQTNDSDWKLSQDLGSVVLLDVWATWCEPCADSLPMYHDLLKEYGGRGLKVYGINVDADSKLAAPFLTGLKVEVPVLLDPGARLSEGALQVKVMPTAFLIDRKGNLRHVHEGFAEEFLQQYVSEIETLLAEKAQ
jgi:cytochrome c biogenesis protein CcmG, thiol:disulfide interchange protein DsbE